MAAWAWAEVRKAYGNTVWEGRSKLRAGLGFRREPGALSRKSSDRKSSASRACPSLAYIGGVSEDTTFGNKLLRSAQQARDWAQGKPARVRVTYVRAPRLDVRKLRARMGLSQTQFAAKFGFSLDSIQNWEQGHRQPDGPARTLLVVIAKNPEAVEAALASP